MTAPPIFSIDQICQALLLVLSSLWTPRPHPAARSDCTLLARGPVAPAHAWRQATLRRPFASAPRACVRTSDCQKSRFCAASAALAVRLTARPGAAARIVEVVCERIGQPGQKKSGSQAQPQHRALAGECMRPSSPFAPALSAGLGKDTDTLSKSRKTNTCFTCRGQASAFALDPKSLTRTARVPISAVRQSACVWRSVLLPDQARTRSGSRRHAGRVGSACKLVKGAIAAVRECKDARL